MFADFFCNKIDNILNNQPPVQEFPNTEDIDNLDEFYTPSNQFIYKQIMSIKSTSRDDHLPASVMHKQQVSQHHIYPISYKHPSNQQQYICSNYIPFQLLSIGLRPISQILLFSKILERTVNYQIFQTFFRQNNTYNNVQKAYIRRSTETCITNDIIIDHKLILTRLLQEGIRSASHMWFTSYITEREYSIYIKENKSKSILVKHGVPQGTILVSVIFNICHCFKSQKNI